MFKQMMIFAVLLPNLAVAQYIPNTGAIQQETTYQRNYRKYRSDGVYRVLANQKIERCAKEGYNRFSKQRTYKDWLNFCTYVILNS